MLSSTPTSRDNDAHLASPEYIAVYIIEGNDPKRSEQVRTIFGHSIFVTHIIKIDVPDDWLQHHQHLSREEAEELYQYNWCLGDARQRMSTNYVLVIKDSSTTNVTSQHMADMVTLACQQKTWHVCYLTKWLDRCDLYTDRNKSCHLVKTYSPHGCQAILFSPEGRDIILGFKRMKDGNTFPNKDSLSDSLNYTVSQGHLDATCFSPNLITYDVTVALHNNDYYKLQECRQPDRIPDNRDDGNINVTESGWGWWIWILLFFFILLLIGLLCFWRRSTLVAACQDPCSDNQRL